MCKVNLNVQEATDEITSNVNLTVITGRGTYEIKAIKEKSIMENLIDNKIKIWAPCNGRGTCGKCKVQLIKGDVKREKSNRILLSDRDINQGTALACCSYTISDCIIKISQENDKEFEILDSYKRDDFLFNPEIVIRKVQINENEMGGSSLTKLISSKIGESYKFSLKSIIKLSTVINKSSESQVSNSLYGKKELSLLVEKNKIIDVYSEREVKAFGVAVDIGTTTIVLSLVDLISETIVNNISILNSQRQFGADVISRIQYSSEKSMKTISDAVKEDITHGIERICAGAKIEKSQIYKVAISGNTVMLHLLMGLFCESIAAYPFNSVINSSIEIKFNELFRSDTLDCTTIILPSASAYVGADITVGMANCDFYKSEEICMLVDIGTNGEMAIGNKGKILSTATAAGPAFEGANIENGVGSINGAICSVKIENSNVIYETIGGEEPVGICGSAVIDIVAEALRNNLIDKTGRINIQECEQNYIKIANSEERNIVFTQKDIRELQLAKSAIRSGIEVLIKSFGCSYRNINKLYIAGGFGNKMNINNAIAIGIIPKELKNKVYLVGNSALGGTVRYLLDKNTYTYIENIISVTETIDISMSEEFNNLFIENMSFD